MSYQLAQLNIAHFKKPRDHEANNDFVANLDRVNAIAEAQPGFVWRLVGDGNDAMDIDVFDDELMIVNLSVWQDIEALSAFVYRNTAHREIMRRRAEWFRPLSVSLVLWWVQSGHIPSVEEAQSKLQQLEQEGATAAAFTFKEPFAPPA